MLEWNNTRAMGLLMYMVRKNGCSMEYTKWNETIEGKKKCDNKKNKIKS